MDENNKHSPCTIMPITIEIKRQQEKKEKKRTETNPFLADGEQFSFQATSHSCTADSDQ